MEIINRRLSLGSGKTSSETTDNSNPMLVYWWPCEHGALQGIHQTTQDGR